MGARVRAEPAWPALHAALRRAHHRGHDPATLLDRVARSRELRTARSVSEVLAWRIGTHLDTHPYPAAGPAPPGSPKLNPHTWILLAWTLKAAENTGRNAAELLAPMASAPDPASALQTLTYATRQHATRHPGAFPPWISPPPALSPESSDRDSEITSYLHASTDAIRARVRALTDDATQSQLGWMNALGTPPEDPARHQEWLEHIGIIAAYRDQYQVSSDDPRQVLGPYAEPGHAGHTAYWHAAASVLTARTLAGLEPAPARTDSVRAQIAADLYLGLPAAERASVNALMAERLGTLWFGIRTETDDHAATRPMYVHQLTAVLTERGHLAQRAVLQGSPSAPAATARPVIAPPVEAALARNHSRGRAARLGSRQQTASSPATRHQPPRPGTGQPLRPSKPERSPQQPDLRPPPLPSHRDQPHQPGPTPGPAV
jgi:hypothetical protein